MKLQIVKGSTSQILTVFIQDDTATDGSGLGSLIHTSSIAGGYVRTGGTGVALAVDEDVATEGTYQAPSTAAHVRIGTPANMITGVYELHFHNDLFAAGADSIVIGLAGAADMAPLLIEIQLTDVNLNDGTRGGMTALPAAVAGASGGVFLGSTGGAVAATGLDLVLKTSTFALAVADAIWDELLTGATHNAATSAGRRLREIAGAVALADGTAQSGTNNTIVLEAGENANNDWYNHARIVLTGGTGAGQSRHVHDYDGGTLAATVYPVWVTNPANDTTYEIYPSSMVHAMEIEADGITNATFAADVGSTAYATNIIALAVRKVLDELNLDHLLAVADADDVVNDSVIGKMASTDGDWSKFSDTTDSLQSIRDVAPHGSAMRGTDGANIVVPPTVAQLNARTLLAAAYFDPTADTVARVTLVDTTTVNTDMRGSDVVPPTVAQLEARTLLAANYFDYTTDEVTIAADQSAVTVGEVTAISAAGMLSIADEVLKRGAANVEDDAEACSLCESLLARFESDIVDTTWTIYKTDHTNAFSTRTVTLDSTADPVTGVT